MTPLVDNVSKKGDYKKRYKIRDTISIQLHYLITIPAVSISPGNHLLIKKSDAVALNGTTVPYSNIHNTQRRQKELGRERKSTEEDACVRF